MAWLTKAVCLWLGLCLTAQALDGSRTAEEDTDGQLSRKILGSSVVTSVSVVMDPGNGKPPMFSDPLGNPVPKPLLASQVASPINLLNPDRYEFYTFNDNGELIKRLMTMQEIQGIIAGGDSENMNEFQQNPSSEVSHVVQNVQNVLKEEMQAHKTPPNIKPVFDTPDVSDTWNMILPAIFGDSMTISDDSNNVDIIDDVTTVKEQDEITNRDVTTTENIKLVTNFYVKNQTSSTINKTETLPPIIIANDQFLFHDMLLGSIYSTKPTTDNIKENNKYTNNPTMISSEKTTEKFEYTNKPLFAQTKSTESDMTQTTKTVTTPSTVKIQTSTRTQPTTQKPTTLKPPKIQTTQYLTTPTTMLTTRLKPNYQQLNVITATTIINKPTTVSPITTQTIQTSTNRPASTEKLPVMIPIEVSTSKPVQITSTTTQQTTTLTKQTSKVQVTPELVSMPTLMDLILHTEKPKDDKVVTLRPISNENSNISSEIDAFVQNASNNLYSNSDDISTQEYNLENVINSLLNTGMGNIVNNPATFASALEDRIKDQPESTTQKEITEKETAATSAQTIKVPSSTTVRIIPTKYIPTTITTKHSTTKLQSTTPKIEEKLTTQKENPTSTEKIISTTTTEKSTDKPTTLKITTTQQPETIKSTTKNPITYKSTPQSSTTENINTKPTTTEKITSRTTTETLTTQSTTKIVEKTTTEIPSTQRIIIKTNVTEKTTTRPVQINETTFITKSTNANYTTQPTTRIAVTTTPTIEFTTKPSIYRLTTNNNKVQFIRKTTTNKPMMDQHTTEKYITKQTTTQPTTTAAVTKTTEQQTEKLTTRTTQIPITIYRTTQKNVTKPTETTTTTQQTTEIPITKLTTILTTNLPPTERITEKLIEKTTVKQPTAEVTKPQTVIMTTKHTTEQPTTQTTTTKSTTLQTTIKPTRKPVIKENTTTTQTEKVTTNVITTQRTTIVQQTTEKPTTKQPTTNKPTTTKNVTIILPTTETVTKQTKKNNTEPTTIKPPTTVNFITKQPVTDRIVDEKPLIKIETMTKPIINKTTTVTTQKLTTQQTISKPLVQMSTTIYPSTQKFLTKIPASLLNRKPEPNTNNSKIDFLSTSKNITSSYTKPQVNIILNETKLQDKIQSTTQKIPSTNKIVLNTTKIVHDASTKVNITEKLETTNNKPTSTTERVPIVTSTKKYTSTWITATQIINKTMSDINITKTTNNINPTPSTTVKINLPAFKKNFTSTTKVFEKYEYTTESSKNMPTSSHGRPTVYQHKTTNRFPATKTTSKPYTTQTNQTNSNQTSTSGNKPNNYTAIPYRKTEDGWKLVVTVTPPLQPTKNSIPPKFVDSVPTTEKTNVDFYQPSENTEPSSQGNFGLQPLNEDMFMFSKMFNELALKFWNTLAKKDISSERSAVVSPFGAISLLGMIFLGARGGTSGEMNDILKLDDIVTFNPHLVFKEVTESVLSQKSSASIVRELYSDYRKGKLLDFYKDRARQFYNGHVEEIDFKRINDIVRRRTNMIVNKQTKGRIPEYFEGKVLTLRPPLSALSTNIFQADCSHASTEGRDGELYFIVLPSMRQRRLVPIPAAVWRKGFIAGYDPELDATAVSLGNMNQEISTVFVMPGQQGHSAPGDVLLRLEARLLNNTYMPETWIQLLKSMMPRPGLEVQIPRFLQRSILNLNDTLKRMGLKEMFNVHKANLRGINGMAKELYFSDVMQINEFSVCGETHQMHMEVYPVIDQSDVIFDHGKRFKYIDYLDEPRFDDYLSLPLALRPRQARVPDVPRLRFDRPFLYFVRHNPTGLIIHMGRFNPRLAT